MNSCKGVCGGVAVTLLSKEKTPQITAIIIIHNDARTPTVCAHATEPPLEQKCASITGSAEPSDSPRGGGGWGASLRASVQSNTAVTRPRRDVTHLTVAHGAQRWTGTDTEVLLRRRGGRSSRDPGPGEPTAAWTERRAAGDVTGPRTVSAAVT